MALLACVGSAPGLLHHMQARLRAMRAMQPRTAPSSGVGADQCRTSGDGRGWQHSSAALGFTSAAPAPPKRSKQPYFEGWAVRVVDATIGVVMVIIGSFRAPGSATFSSHLLALQHHPTGGARDGRVSQLLLDGDAVQIESRSGTYPLIAPHARSPPDFVWRIVSGPSRGGYLQINGSHARLRFATPALAVELDASGRTPWDPQRMAVGPEGWIRRLGALLPCRYFVHSLGSSATVTVTRPAQLAHGRRALGATPEVLRTTDGLAHMEGNYGRLFPKGWVWLNSMSRSERSSLLAVGGRFQIGGLSPQTYLIAFRDAARALAWDFRTTDGDRVREAREACNGTLELDARSRDGRRRLLLSAEAPPSSFGPRIYVPTASGFSDAPGCSEAHGASVRVRAYARESRAAAADTETAHGAVWRLISSHTLGQAALEFGGAHTCNSWRRT